MSDTTASLRRKIDSAGDLQSVVRTMKAMAASSIGQYEQSVRALADYYRTVELGLGACVRGSEPAAPEPRPNERTEAGAVGAVVFGSDQGLVGRFNDVVADHAIETLAALPRKPLVWAVGERVHAHLADAGLPLVGTLHRAELRQGHCLARRADSRRDRDGSGRRPCHRTPPLSTTAPSLARCMRPSVSDCSRWTTPGAVRWPNVPGRRKRVPEVMGGDTATVAGAHPRISVRLPVPGVRRIPRQREREPPGRDAARGQEHRRTPGGLQREISSCCGRVASTRNCSTSLPASKCWPSEPATKRPTWQRSTEQRHSDEDQDTGLSCASREHG